jgi:tetratricopeptide (TPR) repeat protein
MSIKSDQGGAVREQRGGRRELAKAASLAIGVTMLAGSTAACAKIGEVKAMFKFKQANQAYQGQFYDRSAALYEETIANNPNNSIVYFYLGNSYDNLYKPSERGKPENDALLEKAIQNYALAVEKLDANDPTQAKIKSLALQYLMAAYGPDKLDDPVKAEPVIIRLIELEPTEPLYYFQLAKLYEDAGEYAAAEKVYLAGKDARPADPAGYMQLAGYYDRQGEFAKEIAAFEQRAQQEPNNPEGFYTIATQYWDQAYRGAGVTDADKKAYVDKGMTAIDEAIRIRPDYVEAIVYKNLLLRLQANLETSPARQQALIRQADVLRDQAEEIRKKKATGI